MVWWRIYGEEGERARATVGFFWCCRFGSFIGKGVCIGGTPLVHSIHEYGPITIRRRDQRMQTKLDWIAQ